MKVLLLGHSGRTFPHARDNQQIPSEKRERRWQRCQQVMERGHVEWVR